jgi:hypothetical protein
MVSTSEKKILTTKTSPTTIGLRKTSVTTKSTKTSAHIQKISSTKKELPTQKPTTTTTKKYTIETTLRLIPSTMKSPRRRG